MSRLARTFERLQNGGRGGLVTYLTAGDPDADRSVALLVAVARAGADVLEVGVPFSDPLADGPVIQRASERALAGGMSLRGALEVVRRVRAEVDTPIVLFTYANPVVRMDATVFARTAADAGVDGVLVLDYPVEEAEPLRAPLRDAGLDPIFLVIPTTSEERIRKSAALGAGFLYVISRLGVTGVRDKLPADVGGLMARVRACADLPVALGFGIAHPDQVAEACRVADAAVVGSALVKVVAEHAASSNECEHASEYVRWLKNSL
jgi:tryptophan synthase alpha chain